MISPARAAIGRRRALFLLGAALLVSDALLTAGKGFVRLGIQQIFTVDRNGRARRAL